MNNNQNKDNDYVMNFYTSGSADGAKQPSTEGQKSNFSMDGSNYNLNGNSNNNQTYQQSYTSYNNGNFSNANPSYAEYAMPYETTNMDSKVQNVMAKTFAFMFAVLLVTAISAYVTAHSSFIYDLIQSSAWYAVIGLEIVTVILAQVAMKKNKVVLSGIMLLAYSIVNGITLSIVFLAYDLGSVVTMFVLASVVFAVLAIFGLVTKRDLSALGSAGIMILTGVIMLGLINIFAKSSGLSLALAAVGLTVFIGLTAYDVQKIKALAKQNTSNSTTVLAMFGALMLYLDLINIFLYLLRLFGNSND
ncbi:Bax inhibitor-1/YccA family protein [Anaerosporobacter faecicola]|uniref:Bax inhibitor-1/YccA family protein n=1 Tax=Anaerosporobacter faecicola TaxID=2718714 RepID=UPI00143B1CCD|nr:Bax inhibitor-1/YccA family protein [Anaerosporobacter faecicola]